MKELRISDMLGRTVVPGNIIAYFSKSSNGPVLKGCYVVLETTYYNDNSFSLSLSKLYSGHTKPDAIMLGEFENGVSKSLSHKFLRIADGMHAL